MGNGMLSQHKSKESWDDQNNIRQCGFYSKEYNHGERGLFHKDKGIKPWKGPTKPKHSN